MGNEISQLTPEQLSKLKKKTPFDDREIGKLLERYSFYDTSERGTEGIPYDILLTIPELAVCPVAPLVASKFISRETMRIFPEEFLYFWAALSSKTSINAKKQFSFMCLDIHEQQKLQHEELFRWLKLLYSRSLSDDQILSITHQVLHGPQLQTPGEMLQEEFYQFVSDQEIYNIFTVDLQVQS